MSQTSPTAHFLIDTIADSPDATAQVAAKLTDVINGPVLILLKGDLGSGKTLFVRGLCAALGMAELWEVDSPTFTIVNHYDVGPGVYHLDLYRLEQEQELDCLNMDEILNSDAIVTVEWPERLPAIEYAYPVFLVQFERHASSPNARRIRITEHRL